MMAYFISLLKDIMAWIRKMLVIACILALPELPVSVLSEPGQTEAEDTSAIRIRSAPIEGKVFLVSSEEGEEEIPGRNVDVKITRRGEREIIYHTLTVKDGSYQLPKLEPQDYRLQVGDLRLDLKVFPETSLRQDLSKVLIIMIPREMSGAKQDRPVPPEKSGIATPKKSGNSKVKAFTLSRNVVGFLNNI